MITPITSRSRNGSGDLRNILQSVVKSMFWTLLRLIYRVEAHGLVNIPDGPAILIPNHVTFLDALLIAAHVHRPIHFAMHYPIYRRLKWAVAPMGGFPIAKASENPAIYDAAFERMSKALADGELVCIFPEGMLTLDGHLGAFRGGVLRVLARNPVPVVPVGLRNLWGSYFSRKKKGRLHLPDHFMAKIEMVVGLPLRHDVTLHDMELAVAELL